MTEVKNNKAFDFLLYSYFGIKESDLNDQSKKDIPYICAKCAKRAYLDLARTVKYSYSSSELEEMKSKKSSEEDKDKANNFIESKNNLIKNICENILPPIETKEGEISFKNSDFDDWHKAKCREIINFMNNSIDKSNTKILKKEEKFTIGQAQKWVNMTLKYLWLLNALPTGVKPEYLHVPIDSYIIEIAYDNKNKFENALGLLEEKPKKSWSMLSDYEKYFEIQEAIREAIKTNTTNETIPIKWESLAWIEVAEKQANK
ncbi:hypothetical protein RB5AMG_02256 [Ruminococcus bromii]|nr:hypothetical protein [Ruminococcus bromii]PKD26645.1 hypothetical protein RB5AMG_02256 [Ruminococcus bromii]